MSRPPVHVVDFEGSRESGIVEFGVATVSGGRITAAATRLCAPTGRISRRDRETHGIDPADAAGHAPFAAEWPRFSALRHSGPLCAHNAAFEDHLLRLQWPLAGSVPDFVRGGDGTTAWGPWIDTLVLARNRAPALPSHKLEDLVAHFGLRQRIDDLAAEHCPAGRRHYHCALYDAIAAALLLIELVGPDPAADRLLIETAPSAGARGRLDQRDLFE